MSASTTTQGPLRGFVAGSEWATALAWSPDSPLLAIGAGRRLLIVDEDGAVLHDFDDQPSTVTAVAWSPDGTRVGAAAYGGVDWHDVVGPRSGRSRRFDWKGSLLALVLSPDGKWACAGAQDSTVHLWKLWSGRELSMDGYPSKIERLAFRDDSRWLAVACLGELTVWDFGGKGPAGTAPASSSGHDKHIEGLAWSPSGAYIATGGGDGRTIVWGAPTRAGQDLSPATAAESDVSTSRTSVGQRRRPSDRAGRRKRGQAHHLTFLLTASTAATSGGARCATHRRRPSCSRSSCLPW